MHKARLVLAALATALILDGCAGLATRMPGPVTVGPWTSQLVLEEPARLAASHGRAHRAGDDLVLTFRNGKTAIFHSDTRGCEDGPDHCDGFLLAADLQGFHWFVMFESFYEGGRFFLIDDRAGRKVQIPYWPTFSPDGQRVLIQNDDVTSDFPGDNLEIWRRDGTGLQHEWSANPTEKDTGVPGEMPYHSEVQTWQGDRITLNMSSPGVYDTRTRTSAPDRKWTATLIRQADGWHLDARAR